MTEDFVAKALAALRQKRFADARDSIAAYAESNTLEFQHYLIKGLSELALSDWQAAADTFTEATGLFPHQPQLWFNLGTAQENLGKLDDAADSLERSLDLKPEQGDACGNLSNIYRKQGRFGEAEAMAHRAYEFGAPKAQALNSLGLALGKQGKFEAAAKTFQEALQLDPADQQILSNLANLAIDRLDFDTAWEFFAKARALGDLLTIRRDEGMARLLAGDYAAGWTLYEARLELPAALRVRPACPRWRGENLAGKKLMLLAEQGLGDTIMFCRYGKLLADAGAEILWVVQKPLQRLLADNLSGKVFSERDPLPEADYYLPLMSLPLATRKYAPAEAPPAPYLRAPDEPRLPDAKADVKKIGLVWTGSPTHERDHERSISLDRFAPLFAQAKAEFYAPFTGVGLEEITDGTPVTALGNLIGDFSDTAALLRQLDCLVTVDTSVAHLAGALDVTTYLLLQYSPDWRWGTSGTTTPWYARATLLRQPKYGDWDSVIENLANKL